MLEVQPHRGNSCALKTQWQLSCRRGATAHGSSPLPSSQLACKQNINWHSFSLEVTTTLRSMCCTRVTRWSQARDPACLARLKTPA